MPLHRRALLVIVLGGAWACSAPAPERPERVLLVTVDTLRADHVGCYGHPRARTPHWDALAQSGVRFEVAISPAPLTLPAHASLMTGLDPPAHGVRHNSIHRLGEDLPTLAERMHEAGFATAAAVGAFVLDARFGLARGFDHYDDRTAERRSGTVGYAERPADRVVDAALGWLGSAPDRFFLWVHFYDPHQSYSPPPGFASAFPSDPYLGEVAFADAEMGRLIAAIRERWGPTGLLVVATSDHGESLGEHGEPTHAYSLYDATQRVPLVLAGPGLPAGLVAPGPAGLIDVAPTILALAGAEPLSGAGGVDLRTLLGGDEGRSLYMETLATQLDFGWSALFALRSAGFKYVQAPRPELYDLASDPAELRDLSVEDPRRLEAFERDLGARRASSPAFSTSVILGEADRERLRSLGYVVPDVPAGSAPASASGLDPKDGMRILGEVNLAQGDLHEGRPEAALARLRGIDSPGAFVLVQRAAAAFGAGDLESAEADARATLALEPARLDARMLLARTLAARNRSGEADAVLAVLPADTPLAPWAALGAARGDLASRRRDVALERLALARTEYPEEPRLAWAHGDLLEVEGRLEEALEAREAALRALPDDPRASNDVAWSLARLGRDLERGLALARAAAARSREPAVLHTLATLLLATGSPAEAVEVADRGLAAASGEASRQLLQVRKEALLRLQPEG